MGLTVALVGDASGYLDAITGEGIGLALSEGLAAGDALAAGGRATAATLAPYARAHRRTRSTGARLVSG